MRHVVALLVVAAATLAVAVTAASASTSPTNFTFSTTIDSRDVFGGCCTDSSFGSTTGVFPHLGRAKVDEGFGRCDPSYCYPDGSNHVNVVFTAQNGDQLWLSGDGLATVGTDANYTGTGTWSVYQPLSTGRFASAQGSGTYTATFTTTAVFPYYSLGKLSITLSGNLTSA
jgi:hypothetical protein